MKGHVSVEIPVKPYIRAYMLRELGPEMRLCTGQHVIYNKLYDLLEPANSTKISVKALKDIQKEINLSPEQLPVYNKFYELLNRPDINPQKEAASCNYGAKVKIFVSISIYRRRGCNLNNTNVKQFNRFVEGLLKHRYHRLMDDLIAIRPGFEVHLPVVRMRLGIDVEDWADDSMKKDYYRSRKKRNMPMFK